MAAIGSQLGKFARIPGISSFVDIAGAIAELRGWLAYLRSNLKRDTSALLTTADEIKGFIRSVGIDRWSRYWHYGRQLISLQHRLFVEQIYSDLGGEWAKLVTGFGPLKGSLGRIEETRGREQTERMGEEFRRAFRRKHRKQ